MNNMFENYPDVVDIPTLCQMLNIGKNTAYKLLHDSKIKYMKIGKNYKIPKCYLIEYVLNC